MSSITILSLLVLAKSSILIGVCLLTVKILRFRGEHRNAWHIFTAVVLILTVTQAVLLWFLLTSDTCCAYPIVSLHFYAYCWSRWEGTTLYSCQASLFLRGWAVVGDIIYLYPWASFISHLLGSRCVSSWFLCQQGDLLLVHSLNIPRYFVPPVCRTDSTISEDLKWQAKLIKMENFESPKPLLLALAHLLNNLELLRTAHSTKCPGKSVTVF